MRLKWTELEKSSAPVGLMFAKLLGRDGSLRHRRIGDPKRSRSWGSSAARWAPPTTAWSRWGTCTLYLELDQADSAEVYLARLMPFIEAYQIEQLRPNVYFAQGRIAEIRMDYAAAIENFEKQSAIDPDGGRRAPLHRTLPEETRRLHAKADASLARKRSRCTRTTPTSLYELALLQADKDEKEKAIETLDKALAVWKDADPVFKRAREARETRARWEG